MLSQSSSMRVVGPDQEIWRYNNVNLLISAGSTKQHAVSGSKFHLK
jgi:hypothetical protein